MELRQLEAFVAVATELHFGRAAEKLFIGQPTLSDLIRRLERELGIPLLTRTTRRVALTEAGVELLRRSTGILHDVEAASRAVEAIASGDGGTVRIAITPPAAPVLAPYLRTAFAAEAPGVEVVQSQQWLPTLIEALAGGAIDVALTCGTLAEYDRVEAAVFCAQPLLVGLRPGHVLASGGDVAVERLASATLGTTEESLFPAWALAQRQALRAMELSPPEVPLVATDLAATRWMDQPELEWIMLIESLAAGHQATAIRRVVPSYDVPFTVLWNKTRAETPAVSRFVEHALSVAPPPGWSTGADHHDHVG